MKVSFIGGGVMAEALIKGTLDFGVFSSGDIVVSDPLSNKLEYLHLEYGVDVSESNEEVIESSDVVILAVKPQTMSSVTPILKDNLREDQVVISIVAGMTLEKIAMSINHPTVIRVMPNTAAQIGKSMSVWACEPSVSEEHRALTARILNAVGEEYFVHDEKLLDMSTALSASGPAYVLLFIEALIDGGVSLGMPREMAKVLTMGTVLGSTEMVKLSGEHTASLRDLVTSPGGTTIEAILSLENAGFRGSIMTAVRAAYDRSLQLGLN